MCVRVSGCSYCCCCFFIAVVVIVGDGGSGWCACLYFPFKQGKNI